ncbi:MAG: hypothetical protein CL607_13960 [Anaerolineaceae bacterium]|nr:hypothetical protein [Anaerolineaceae bacterium]
MTDLSQLSPMHQQIYTLPDLLSAITDPFDVSARQTFSFEMCTSVKQIYLVGCGDSHHAPVGAELAFNQITGVPTRALSSMQFSHYTAGFLPDTGPNTTLVITISVSGVVSRTIEALRLAQKVGAMGVALTGNPDAKLASHAQHVFKTTVPPLPDEMQGMIVPGIRSYTASQIGLYSAAIRIGEVRGHITTAYADQLRAELKAMAGIAEATIQACQPIAHDLVRDWEDLKEFVFVGAGPNYGVAMFTAAKVLEASGDAAWAQDVEEWAHLQYFSAEPATPTTFISTGDTGGLDRQRTAEVVNAANAIGRRTAGILPEAEQEISGLVQAKLPVMGAVREAFYPVVASIPGELIAAERAEHQGTEYFQGFGGGRNSSRGDKTNKIYDSVQLDEVQR